MKLKIDRFPEDATEISDAREIDILTDTGEVLLSIVPDLENDRIEVRTGGGCSKNNGHVIDGRLVLLPGGSNSVIIGRPEYK